MNLGSRKVLLVLAIFTRSLGCNWQIIRQISDTLDDILNKITVLARSYDYLYINVLTSAAIFAKLTKKRQFE